MRTALAIETRQTALAGLAVFAALALLGQGRLVGRDAARHDQRRSVTLLDLERTGQRGIDLNSASPRLLARLPGIGPALSRRIAIYRDELFRFRAPEDLSLVPGIAQDRLRELIPFVQAEPP